MRSADAPPFIVVCGPPGCGKTTDIARAVGPVAAVSAAEGALKSVRSVLGGDLFRTEFPAKTLSDATTTLRQLAQLKRNPRTARLVPKWYVADEFSYMAERTWAILSKRYSGWRVWSAMRDEVIAFRDAARDSGIGIIANTWEQGPTTKSNGNFVRGGPQLPSDLPEQFPGIADWIIRAVYDPAMKPWPWRYQAVGDAEWVLKCRDAVIGPRPPMNLGECLRAAGYEAARPADADWIEPVVQALSPAFETVLRGDVKQQYVLANQAYALLLSEGRPPHYATWCVQDALDRARIKVFREQAAATFAVVGNDNSNL